MAMGSFLPILKSAKALYSSLKLAVEAEAAAQTLSVSMNEAAIIVKNKNALATIFEKESTNKLTKEEAIQQIKDKYLSSVRAKFDNVTTACIYGIAFYKKECKVIFEKIDV